MITKKITNQGFTIVEILVVTAIVGMLAAISIPIGIKVFNSGLRAKSETHMKAFVDACDDFKRDHGSITYKVKIVQDSVQDLNDCWVFTSLTGFDEVTESNSNMTRGSSNSHLFIRALVGGEDSAGYSKNRNQYLTLENVKEDYTGGGITRNSNGEAEGLLDPWGRSYVLIIDYSYDHEIKESWKNLGNYANQTINLDNSHVGLLSVGQDGKVGTDDDIVSWN